MADSIGIDRATGLPLLDLDHVAQSVSVIFSTRIGEMIMLRWFGAGLAELLGKRVTPKLLAIYRTILALGIYAWEPRLQVVRIAASGNTRDGVRLGELSFEVLCYYRPRAHLGDLTIQGGLNTFNLRAQNNKLLFTYGGGA